MMKTFRDVKIDINERITLLINELTLEEKIGFLPRMQNKVERLCIEEYKVGGEAAHGIVIRKGEIPTHMRKNGVGNIIDEEKEETATIFPSPIGIAATWDKNLVKEIGSAIGDEARVYYNKKNKKGGLTLWAPTVDMERDPRWGRSEEAYGEDPCLAGNISVSYIKGLQGEDPYYIKAGAALKHFYGNNNEKDRGTCSATFTKRNKHEYYIRAFEKGIKEGKVVSLMTAYNLINGIPCICNPEINTVLREKFGFDGFVVSDSGDLNSMTEFKEFTRNNGEALAYCLKNGLDVFTDKTEVVIEAAKEALNNGYIAEEDIDKSLRRILKIRFRLGHFDGESVNPYDNISEEVLECEKHKTISEEAAKKAVVLLKNNGILPLKKEKINKIAVIGPLSDETYKGWYTGNYSHKETPLDAIKKEFEEEKVIFEKGWDDIALKEVKTNKYLSIDDNLNLMVSGSDFYDKNNTFQYEEWGYNKVTFKSSKNKKYLTIGENNTLKATADNVYGWFLKEEFKVSKTKGGFTLKSWDNLAVDVDEKKKNIKVSKFGESILKKEVVKDGIESAKRAAKDSDVAVVFVGHNPLINGRETEDRPGLMLSKHQEDLINSVYNANKNTIVVVLGNYPFTIKYAKDNVPAIIYSAQGCQSIGKAISQVLIGKYSPSGKLPMTWYKDVDDLPDIMDYDIIKGNRTYMYFDKEVLFPFGHGLNYAKFKFHNLKVEDTSEDVIKISVDVENLSDIASDEVIQIYTRMKKSRVKRPVKELKEFSREHFIPREIRTLFFTIDVNDLKFYDVSREKMALESGKYEIMVATSSQNIKLSKEIFIEGEIIPERDLSRVTKAENFDDYRDIEIGALNFKESFVDFKSKNSYIKFENCRLNQVSNFRVKTIGASGKIKLFLNSIENIATCINNEESDIAVTNESSLSTLNGVYDILIKADENIKIVDFQIS